MTLKKLIEVRFVCVAISQLCGLASFTFVAKYLLDSSEIKMLASYQGLQAITAFLMMSIQYSNCRSAIFGVKFAFLFFSVFGSAAFFIAKGGGGFLWCMCVLITFASACYSNLFLTALEKYKILLFFQIFCSALFPFSIIFPFVTAFLFLAAFIFLFIRFKSQTVILSDMQIFQDGKSWMSSLSMEAPLVLLPVFDPFLVNLIGAEIYRSYVIALKYSAGPINLIFSTAQFRVLERSFFDVSKIGFACIACFVLSLLLVVFKAHLLLQVISLVLFTNCVSLLVRVNNLKGNGWWSFMVGPVSLGGYYLFLKSFSAFYEDAENYFILGMLLCIAFNAFFSMVGVVRDVAAVNAD